MDTTTVPTSPPTDTIRVAELLDLVRKHTDEHDWCADVEAHLQRLGLEFEEAGACFCVVCAAWKKENRPDLAPRFTLVEDSPETVTKAALVELIRFLDGTYESGLPNLIAEAIERFGLKVEATR